MEILRFIYVECKLSKNKVYLKDKINIFKNKISKSFLFFDNNIE
jgi:hypothetical protein